MTRSEFKSFVEKTLDELKLTAETFADKALPEFSSFQWLRESEPIHTDRENIVEAIVRDVYVDSDQIYPCVDLRVYYSQDKKELIIKGFRANYHPRPFQRGWSNRPGPFIYAISQELYGSKVDVHSETFQNRMYEMGLWHKSSDE